MKKIPALIASAAALAAVIGGGGALLLNSKPEQLPDLSDIHLSGSRFADKQTVIYLNDFVEPNDSTESVETDGEDPDTVMLDIDNSYSDIWTIRFFDIAEREAEEMLPDMKEKLENLKSENLSDSEATAETSTDESADEQLQSGLRGNGGEMAEMKRYGAGNETFRESQPLRAFVSRTMPADVVRRSTTPRDGFAATLSGTLLTNGKGTWQLSDGSVRHHAPLSFALTARWPFSRRWTLEGGIAYTLLKSDFTYSNLQPRDVRQRLDYLGVPLRLRTKILRLRRLTFSAYGGAQADICVAASRKADGTKLSAKIDRPQMSAAAALTAEYAIGRRLGIYIEPTLRYYFKNKSSVETPFKQRPTQFNIQLGASLKL